jgi:hypothetical protein
MKHLFAPYELALLAKENGFNEPCIVLFQYSYDEEMPRQYLPQDGVPRPLYQQLVEWLDSKGVVICPDYNGNTFSAKIFDKNGFYDTVKDRNNNVIRSSNRQEIIEFALTEAFKLI